MARFDGHRRLCAPLARDQHKCLEEAIEAFGPEDAAVVLAAILQRSSLINSAGGYLRTLTKKVRAGSVSLGQMLMALIRANLQKGSQKMRAKFRIRAGACFYTTENVLTPSKLGRFSPPFSHRLHPE